MIIKIVRESNKNFLVGHRIVIDDGVVVFYLAISEKV